MSYEFDESQNQYNKQMWDSVDAIVTSDSLEEVPTSLRDAGVSHIPGAQDDHLLQFPGESENDIYQLVKYKNDGVSVDSPKVRDILNLFDYEVARALSKLYRDAN